jgi:pyruvate dehydrogenase E2 component (dihydrolipoamide acetyltransferase)
MATAVVMPKLGNSVESSIIVNWKKQVGESINTGDAICEVETDKAAIDVESPASGIILALFFAAGDDVPVMTNIAAIGAQGENIDHLRPAGAAAPAVASPSVSNGAPTVTPAPQAAPIQAASSEFVGISPRARNLAARKGLPYAQLSGTGPGGRIIERDIEAALARQPRLTPVADRMVAAGTHTPPPTASGSRITSKDLLPAAQAAPTPQPVVGGDVTIIAVKGVRKVIAQRMLQSLQTTAQLTLNSFADARALQAYRKRLKESAESLGLRAVTINDLVLFVVARSLQQMPEMNAHFEGDTITQYADVHLGFAVDTPRGLIVPVVQRAQTLSLKALASETSRLAKATQDGTLKPNDLEGGTFTVSNLGSLGIETFTPVLNPPQVGILGVGSIHLKPMDVGGDVQFIPHIALSLTINHQVIDGAPGARFLQTLAQNIAQIETVLAL